MDKRIELPESFNYIAAFLSLGCNLSCSYCINHTVGLNPRRKHLSGKEWISFLNKIQPKKNLPITIQGGEPTIHPDFYEIIKGIDSRHAIDLLTNIQFDPEVLMNQISPKRFDRNLPYPSIRVSYHPETMDLNETINKVKILHDNKFSIGIFSVDHPDYQQEIVSVANACEKLGIFFRTKELLDKISHTTYGTYKYPEAVFSDTVKNCMCKNSELLISPEGEIYKCHHDLYNRILPIDNVKNENLVIKSEFRHCSFYGRCNPCDIKLKNNRFQQFNHCSVEIKLS
ncbi:radical SAM protein [Bacteriovoracaceae bacterium]|nr:radical SAM protein [Bacteriovoracaceae bacterium]